MPLLFIMLNSVTINGMLISRKQGRGDGMIVRPYQAEDIDDIVQLFYDTVHTINARDYTQQQLDVWATGEVDRAGWNESFLSHTTAVALINNRIVGFGDMDAKGYLDRLYVHKDFQRIGIASAICLWLEDKVKSNQYVTHASITARPFFEAIGYVVIRQQQVERQGVFMTNFVMEKVR